MKKNWELLLKVVDARNKYDEGVSQCLRIVADEENARGFLYPVGSHRAVEPPQAGAG